MRFFVGRHLTEEHWPAEARAATTVNKFQRAQVDVQGASGGRAYAGPASEVLDDAHPVEAVA